VAATDFLYDTTIFLAQQSRSLRILEGELNVFNTSLRLLMTPGIMERVGSELAGVAATAGAAAAALLPPAQAALELVPTLTSAATAVTSLNPETLATPNVSMALTSVAAAAQAQSAVVADVKRTWRMLTAVSTPTGVPERSMPLLDARAADAAAVLAALPAYASAAAATLPEDELASALSASAARLSALLPSMLAATLLPASVAELLSATAAMPDPSNPAQWLFTLAPAWRNVTVRDVSYENVTTPEPVVDANGTVVIVDGVIQTVDVTTLQELESWHVELQFVPVNVSLTSAQVVKLRNLRAATAEVEVLEGAATAYAGAASSSGVVAAAAAAAEMRTYFDALTSSYDQLSTVFGLAVAPRAAFNGEATSVFDLAWRLRIAADSVEYASASAARELCAPAFASATINMAGNLSAVAASVAAAVQPLTPGATAAAQQLTSLGVNLVSARKALGGFSADEVLNGAARAAAVLRVRGVTPVKAGIAILGFDQLSNAIERMNIKITEFRAAAVKDVPAIMASIGAFKTAYDRHGRRARRADLWRGQAVAVRRSGGGFP
jgi:hypothetical protein